MSRHRSRRLDRQAAERLLRGRSPEPSAGPDPLAELLAAAATTSRDGELAGEQAAVRAFRAAHLGPVAEPRRPSVRTSLLANLLTVKLAVAGLAVGAVGGVAVAAATGVLPAGPGIVTTGPQGSGGLPAASATSPNAPQSGDAARERAQHDAHGAATPAALLGLCHSFRAAAVSQPRRTLDNPAFSALVTAAGGKEKVPGYCSSVIHDARVTGPDDGAGPGRSPAPAPRPGPFDSGRGSVPVPPGGRPSPPVEPGPAGPAGPAGFAPAPPGPRVPVVRPAPGAPPDGPPGLPTPPDPGAPVPDPGAPVRDPGVPVPAPGAPDRPAPPPGGQPPP